MGTVAYTLKAAARAASVEKATITLAIQDHELVARRVGGSVIVLRCDLKRWLETLPAYITSSAR